MKFLIADDHTVVREGLKVILSKLKGVAQIEEVTKGTDALKKIENNIYDLVILDISLPGMSGLEVLKNIKIRNIVTPVLILSMHPEEQYALRALRSGASGYVTKDRAGEELLAAIRKISSGGRYLSSELAEYIAFNFDKKTGLLLHEKLSEREFEVMLLLARGRSVKETAGELFISEKTVGTHRARIMNKMGIKKNSELIVYAIKNKLIE